MFTSYSIMNVLTVLTFGVATVTIIVITVTILIALLKWHFNYWKRVEIPFLNPIIPFGDAKKLVRGKCNWGEQFVEFYTKFKKNNYKHGGVFVGAQKFYVVIDLELAKNILTQKFDHFRNRGNFFNEKKDPLSANLFNLENQKWKNMRTKLSPTFTSSKMKMMFETLENCALELNTFMQEFAISHKTIDIKDILGRFTTDVISSIAFGLECNSIKNPNAEFRKYGKKIFEASFVDRLRILMHFGIPHSLLKFINFRTTKHDVEKFFIKTFYDTVEDRERNNIFRADFMDLLIQLKNHGSVFKDINNNKKDEKLTMIELAAQAFVFFSAGLELSSNTMAFAFYELAINQEVQAKLRTEIQTVLRNHDGKLTYKTVMSMTYMDQLIHECLRKYPPVAVLRRQCHKNYQIPGTTAILEKGLYVAIPVLAIHRDPEYYPNPAKFDPERFSEKNKNTRPSFSFLAFGDGPRVCIARRFGLMQIKVGLATILNDFKVTLNSKTNFPLQLQPASVVTSPKGGVWLDIEKIK